MAWSASKIFSATITDLMNNTTAIDLNTDASIKAALYNNTTAPDQTVTSANTAYGVGQWVVGNEVSDTTEWPATGQALGTITSGFTSNVYTFDAADEVSDGVSATLAAVFGCLVYDDTIATPVADQGLCYNYFGGTNSVTDGTFTIVWHASGIFALTL
jgi:hypothetical protein